MVTFNSYRVYKNEAGETFLDLEVLLSMHEQSMIIRYTFPATANLVKLLPDKPDQNHADNSGHHRQ